MRHPLANFEQRLGALGKRIAATGAVMTEGQAVELDKKREDDVALDEIKTTHPVDSMGLIMLQLVDSVSLP
jgi:hypothetical protein